MNNIIRKATAIKEKARLIRCTNWLVSQNYVSFWRTPPPVSRSRNHWKCIDFSPENRGAWLMFHPPPTNDSWATQLYQRAIITINTNHIHALCSEFWGWWKKNISPITNWSSWLFYTYKFFKKRNNAKRAYTETYQIAPSFPGA